MGGQTHGRRWPHAKCLECSSQPVTTVKLLIGVCSLEDAAIILFTNLWPL